MKAKKAVDMIERYTIAVTGIMVFAISLGGFWLFTQKMIEDVLFMSILTSIFATFLIGNLIEKGFDSIRKGLGNAQK